MARFKNTNYEIIYVFIDNIHRPTKILIIPQLFHVIPPTLSRFKAQKHPISQIIYHTNEHATHLLRFSLAGEERGETVLEKSDPSSFFPSPFLLPRKHHTFLAIGIIQFPARYCVTARQSGLIFSLSLFLTIFFLDWQQTFPSLGG